MKTFQVGIGLLLALVLAEPSVAESELDYCGKVATDYSQCVPFGKPSNCFDWQWEEEKKKLGKLVESAKSAAPFDEGQQPEERMSELSDVYDECVKMYYNEEQDEKACLPLTAIPTGCPLYSFQQLVNKIFPRDSDGTCYNDDGCAEGHICQFEGDTGYCVVDESVSVSESSPEGTVEKCFSDDECDEGHTCQFEGDNGYCVLTPTDIFCRSNADCGAAERCQLDIGDCVVDESVSVSESSPEECFSDDECDEDETCEIEDDEGDRYCVAKDITKVGNTCTADADCAEGFTCQLEGDTGSCVSETAVVDPGTGHSGCKINDDCDLHMICQLNDEKDRGFCISVIKPVQDETCTKDANCDVDEICQLDEDKDEKYCVLGTPQPLPKISCKVNKGICPLGHICQVADGASKGFCVPENIRGCDDDAHCPKLGMGEESQIAGKCKHGRCFYTKC